MANLGKRFRVVFSCLDKHFGFRTKSFEESVNVAKAITNSIYDKHFRTSSHVEMMAINELFTFISKHKIQQPAVEKISSISIDELGTDGKWFEVSADGEVRWYDLGYGDLTKDKVEMKKSVVLKVKTDHFIELIKGISVDCCKFTLSKTVETVESFSEKITLSVKVRKRKILFTGYLIQTDTSLGGDSCNTKITFIPNNISKVQKFFQYII